MRVVLYEWCLSGGLAGGDAAIAREGRMMLEALAADAVKDPALDVTVLVEAGRTVDLPDCARAVTVPVGDDRASLVAAARTADWVRTNPLATMKRPTPWKLSCDSPIPTMRATPSRNGSRPVQVSGCPTFWTKSDPMGEGGLIQHVKVWK